MACTCAAYSTLQRPTAVHLSCSLRLSNNRDHYSDVDIASKPHRSHPHHLALVRGAQLEIYRVLELDNCDTPLELLHCCTLLGRPLCMQSARFPGSSKTDSLLLAFGDGTMSRIDINPATNELETSAMHAFASNDARISTDNYRPILSVDPNNRCAAVSLSGDTILVWPFREHSKMKHESTTMMMNSNIVQVSAKTSESVLGCSSSSISEASTFILDLKEYGISRISDMVFLAGFLEPSLLILHESDDTWSGRAAIKSRTKCLTAISLNLSLKRHYKICEEPRFPFDTLFIRALPMPLGGALIFCSSVIIHFKQKVEFVLSVNEFGDSDDTFAVAPVPSSIAAISLDGCKASILSNDTGALALSNGDLYSLKIHTSGSAIGGISLALLGHYHVPSCVSFLSNSQLFVGSSIDDSFVFTVNFLEKDPLDRISVSDRLFSASPLSCMVSGCANITKECPEPSPEIVGCCGFGNSGSLAVFKEGVVADTLSSYDFKDTITGVWAIGPISTVSSIIVISTSSSTSIMQTSPASSSSSSSAASLVSISSRELLHCFILSSSTVLAGVIAQTIVQVYAKGIRFVSTSDWTFQDVKLEDTSIDIVDASIMASFVVVRLSNGGLGFSNGVGSYSDIQMLVDQEGDNSRIISFTLHLDNGSLSQSFQDHNDITKPSSSNLPSSLANDISTADDLEMLLFGDDSASSVITPKTASVPESTVSNIDQEQGVCIVVICRSDCSLELRFLPSYRLLFRSTGLLSGFATLIHEPLQHSISSSHSSEAGAGSDDAVAVEKIVCVSTASDEGEAHLSKTDGAEAPLWIIASLTNGDVLLYRSFTVFDLSSSSSSQLRFSRIAHDVVSRTPIAASSSSSSSPYRPLVLFSSRSSRSGIFVGGSRPFWFFSDRGYLRSISYGNHPAAAVTAFASFSIGNDQLFLIGNNDGVVRVCSLPSSSAVYYGSRFSVSKTPLKQTPHMITFHESSSTYTVVTSEQQQVMSLEEITDRSLPVFDQQFGMSLYLPGANQRVDSFADFDNEAILCVEQAELVFGERMNRKIASLAVGTSNIEGEEHCCRGRIILFEVHDTTPSDTSGGGLRYKFVFASKEKGPVTALAGVQGVLCACVGPRVLMYRWAEDHLVGCAFFDADFYIARISSMKGFIALGDVFRGLILLYWEPELKQLMCLGRDLNAEEIYDVGFLVDEDLMSVVVSDSQCNLRVFSYAPHRPESFGGLRLLAVADMHSPCRISNLLPLRSRDLPFPGSMSSAYSTRLLSLASSVDGSISCLSPLDELLYRRLYSLQTQMTYQLPHLAGLNPKANNQNHGHEIVRSSMKNILDIAFLMRFAFLDRPFQIKLAEYSGATPDQIIDDLLQIYLTSFIRPISG